MDTEVVAVRCFDCGHEWLQPVTEEVTVCPKCGGQDLVDAATDAMAGGDDEIGSRK
jgi:DNA-directed RNA polymerase subunit RPC12/RpoP